LLTLAISAFGSVFASPFEDSKIGRFILEVFMFSISIAPAAFMIGRFQELIKALFPDAEF
jgi:hypothetical protein